MSFLVKQPAQNVACSSILEAKKILLDNATVHATPKHSDDQCIDQYWSLTIQVMDCLVYSPVQGVSAALGLTGCQTHCTLQCNWLHKPFYRLTIFTLSLFASTVCIGMTKNPQQRVPSEMAGFPLGKGGSAQ